MIIVKISFSEHWQIPNWEFILKRDVRVNVCVSLAFRLFVEHIYNRIQ